MTTTIDEDEVQDFDSKIPTIGCPQDQTTWERCWCYHACGHASCCLNMKTTSS